MRLWPGNWNSKSRRGDVVEGYCLALQTMPEEGGYYKELALLLMLKDSEDAKEIESMLLKAAALGVED